MRGDIRGDGRGPARLAAAGGVVGPAAFLAAWSLIGRQWPGYSPVEDAISQLAATDAPHRAAMTTGLVTFGAGVVLFGTSLRGALPGPAWACATATGLGALGVAATPLGSSTGDAVHGGFATVGYASLVATLLTAAPPLARSGHRQLARWAVGLGVLSGGCLVATVIGPATGLFQRTGLTAGHLWIAATAVEILRGRLPGARPVRAWAGRG